MRRASWDNFSPDNWRSRASSMANRMTRDCSAGDSCLISSMTADAVMSKRYWEFRLIQTHFSNLEHRNDLPEGGGQGTGPPHFCVGGTLAFDSSHPVHPVNPASFEHPPVVQAHLLVHFLLFSLRPAVHRRQHVQQHLLPFLIRLGMFGPARLHPDTIQTGFEQEETEGAEVFFFSCLQKSLLSLRAPVKTYCFAAPCRARGLAYALIVFFFISERRFSIIRPWILK